MFSRIYKSFLPAFTLQVEQVRGRKRNLKKPLTKQQRLERRLKREQKEAKRKQFSFMQRIFNRKLSKLLSPSQQYPGRYDAEKEHELDKVPDMNVFIRSEYCTYFYTISKALELHRLIQSPTVFNHPNDFLKLRLELNMTTEKATKMISNSDQIAPVPFPFKQKEKRTILAFANSKEQQEIAVGAGAEIALGADMIKKILKGQFLINDYDFCISHTDMAYSILPLRGLLRSKFPNAINGALGNDLPAIIRQFVTGVKLSIKGDPVFPQWGLCEPIIGQLSMPNEEIEENIAAIVKLLCKQRSPALGPFINRGTLTTLSDKTYFSLDLSKYIPVATEEDLKKLESRKKKKKKEKKETIVEDTSDDSYLLALM